MSLPLVSIIIPCFNAEPYVAAAIQSALGQTHSNCEVIVVDDGSTDGSLQVVRAFGDAVRIITGSNRGGCNARNKGMKAATGTLLQFLDADDILHHERIEILVRAHREFPSADYAWAPNIKFWGSQAPATFARSQLANVKTAASRAPLSAAYTPSASLFKAAFLADVGPWNETLSRWVDLEYHARIAKHAKTFAVVDVPLYGYRQHNSGRISDGNRTHKNSLGALESLTLAHRALSESRIDARVWGAYLFPFYVHIARAAAETGDKNLFRRCLREAARLDARWKFRMKAIAATTFSSLFGIRMTNRLIEKALPTDKNTEY